MPLDSRGGGNDVGLIVGRFPTVARPIFVCRAKPVSFTWPSLKGRETKEELPQGANGPTVCRSQGVSGKVSHTKLPSLWPSYTMTKPQTQPFWLGYVNCWAFGPISLVKFFVGNDKTDGPKALSAIQTKLLKAMNLQKILRSKAHSGF